MAIYQFPFTVIPKSGVMEKYGFIPEQLHIDHEAWERHYERMDLDNPDESFDFEDALTIDWWRNSGVKAETIIEEVDSIASRASWNNSDVCISWKNEGDDIADEDASILIDKKTKRVLELGFRFDIRFGANKFLITLLGLCSKNGLLLLDTRGNLIDPKLEHVFELVKTSNANRFVTNPNKLFDDLNKGIIKIE